MATQGKASHLAYAILFCLVATVARGEGIDSDRDLLSDADEAIWGTDPANPDSDGDGFLDGEEVEWGSLPTDPNDTPNLHGGAGERTILFGSCLSAKNNAAPSVDAIETTRFGSAFTSLNTAEPTSETATTSLIGPAFSALNNIRAADISVKTVIVGPIISALNRSAPFASTSTVTLAGPPFSIRNEASLAWSAVSPLPDRVAASGFRLNWSGGGEPGASYEIYAAKDDGDFSLWAGPTTSTTAFFQGAPGATYRFYSRAIDSAGEKENAPATPDAMTKINGPPSLTRAAVHPQRPVLSNVLSVICFGWLDADGDSASYRYQWKKNAAPIPGATSPTLTSDFFHLGDSLSCVVTPWDRLDTGAPTETPPVVIHAQPQMLILSQNLL